MQLLLDTHAFIWFISGNNILPKKVVDAIKDIDNKNVISA
jgi:PIN domain nuclease of toxin-antitoxin system